MYSFMDKCTLFCYFNKTVAGEVVWRREGKIPTSFIWVFQIQILCVFSCTQKTHSMWPDKRKILSCVVRAFPSIPSSPGSSSILTPSDAYSAKMLDVRGFI